MSNIRIMRRFSRFFVRACIKESNVINYGSTDSQKCLTFIKLTTKLSSLQQYRELHFGTTLYKYNKKSNQLDDESDDEDDTEFKDERDSKVVKTKVNSLRADLLLRSGLGMARNKIEVVFYESKIRVNGKKLQKKSTQLNVGDEIDIIRGVSPNNPTHLVVSRVVILSANEREDTISVNLRRYKTLLVENYVGMNAFKSSEISAH